MGKTDNKLAIMIQGDKYHDTASEKGLPSPAGVTAGEGFLQQATLRYDGQVGISQVDWKMGFPTEGTTCSRAQISRVDSPLLEVPMVPPQNI